MTGDPKEPLSDELPADLARMLHAERAAPAPSAGAEQRVLSRLEQTLGLPPPSGDAGGGNDGGAASPSAMAGAAAGTGISKAAAVVAAAVAFGVGAGAGALGHSSLQAPPVASVEVRTVVSVVRVIEPAPSVTVAPPLSPAAAPSASALTRPRAPGSAVDPGARDRALAEENALIARAQAALSRGNVAQARSALNEHAARFPNGQLGVERKLLEAHTARLEKSTP